MFNIVNVYVNVDFWNININGVFILEIIIINLDWLGILKFVSNYMLVNDLM